MCDPRHGEARRGLAYSAHTNGVHDTERAINNQNSILNEEDLDAVAGGFWRELFTGAPTTPSGGGHHPRTVTGTVLNGSALSLVQPPYLPIP